MSKVHYRSVFLSDVHLGTRGCQADALFEFLDSLRCDYLYLVGDIVDVWALRRRFYWPESHNRVLRKIFKMAKKGTEVVFVPGNHDELFRGYVGEVVANVQVAAEAVHTTRDGRQILLLHGDKFDLVMQNSRWLVVFGSVLYDICLDLNRRLNALRQRLGRPYWSVSAYLKRRVKQAVKYIGNFEAAVVTEAQLMNVDAIISGHIHHPELKWMGDVLYGNCGDWVESLSALVEHPDGSLELLKNPSHS